MRRPCVAILGALLLGSAACADEGLSRPTEQIARLIEEAPEGATVRVPPGRYAGSLRVAKPVVLDGAGAVTIDGGGKGTVVELLAPNVTFRGFHVRASGSGVSGEPAGIRVETGPVIIEDNRLEDTLFGIDLRTSPGSIVRRNTVVGKPLEPGRRGDGIRLWWSHGCTIEDNQVQGARDMVFWYSENLRITRNHVVDSRYGLHFMYSHDTTLSENSLERNSVGVYLMYSNRITLTGNMLTSNRGPSGYGIGLKDCDDIIVRDNLVTANRVGLYVDNSPSGVDATGVIEDNLIAFNEMGMLITPNTRRNTLTGNGFVENEEQVAVHGRGDVAGNAFAGDERGNFWSDYPGFDRDGDGIGDLPHEARSLFEALLTREPNLRLFIHSPAQQAIEFTARALPEMRPDPKFVDPLPLMSPPVLVDRSRAAGARSAMTLAAIGLLGVASLTLVLASRSPGLPRPRAGANTERGTSA